MRTKAQKWGNSLAFRVPKGIAEEAGVKTDDVLEIEVKEGNIVLIPASHQEYELESLLKGITQENLHDEVDFGEPVGREAL